MLGEHVSRISKARDLTPSLLSILRYEHTTRTDATNLSACNDRVRLWLWNAFLLEKAQRSRCGSSAYLCRQQLQLQARVMPRSDIHNFTGSQGTFRGEVDSTQAASRHSPWPPPLIPAASITSDPLILNRTNNRFSQMKYFTVLHCGRNDTSVCLVYRTDERWLFGKMSDDGVHFPRSDFRIAFGTPQELEYFSGRPKKRLQWMANARMLHNYAFARHSGSVFMVGGQAHSGGGIWMTHAPLAKGLRSYHRGVPSVYEWGTCGTPSGWRIIRGDHPGCADKRTAPNYTAEFKYVRPGLCEFDGRLSLVTWHGSFLLYARANPARNGQRFVQFASAPNHQLLPCDRTEETHLSHGRMRGWDTLHWSSFQLIRIHGYDRTKGELYFFAVQPSPTEPRKTLVAIFPLTYSGHGCIGMATSHDGRHWSAVRSLLPSKTNLDQIRPPMHDRGRRTHHHPVAGLIVRHEKSVIDIYVHENVPGIADSGVEFAELAMVGEQEKMAPRIIRYRIPFATWSQWTR